MKVFGKYHHKSRDSGGAVGAVAAIIAVLSIPVLAVVGYVMNIVALVGTPLVEFGMMEIVRIIGIFVASRLCDWLLLRWSNATSDLSFYSSLVL